MTDPDVLIICYLRLQKMRYLAIDVID
jgi:hypothetical protein